MFVRSNVRCSTGIENPIGIGRSMTRISGISHPGDIRYCHRGSFHVFGRLRLLLVLICSRQSLINGKPVSVSLSSLDAFQSLSLLSSTSSPAALDGMPFPATIGIGTSKVRIFQLSLGLGLNGRLGRLSLIDSCRIHDEGTERTSE